MKTQIELAPFESAKIHCCILDTLLYFDLFKHPLNEDELWRFCQSSHELEQIRVALDTLVSEGVVFKVNGFYSLAPDPERIKRRIEANRCAAEKMKVARSFSKLMANFPYVESILLSGSLSKGVMYPDSDIDYFIVTRKGRLWVTKLLLTFFKKTILLNSYRNFCINYLISENALEIEEKNHFTATEIVTLKPVYGYGVYENFIQQNGWTGEIYPNYPKQKNEGIVPRQSGLFRNAMEFVFDRRLGDWIDNWYMNFISSKYRREHNQKLGEDGVKVAFKSTPDTSKVHPNHYQRKFLARYSARRKEFYEKFGTKLSHIPTLNS